MASTTDVPKDPQAPGKPSMRDFSKAVQDFVKREDGPTQVEYAVMLALIIVVCLTAITMLPPQPKPEEQQPDPAREEGEQ